MTGSGDSGYYTNMSGPYNNQGNNPSYNTIPGPAHTRGGGGAFVINSTDTGPQFRQGPGGHFRIVMPQEHNAPSAQSPQVIHIGPSGVRAQGGGPNVRVLERQPSGQMRVISSSGPSGSVQVLESPLSTMRRVQVDQPESLPQGFRINTQPGVRVIPISRGGSGHVLNMVPSTSQGPGQGAYRINMIQGDGDYQGKLVSTPPANVYVSSSAPFHETQEPQIYYSRNPPDTPSTPGTASTGSPYHTLTRSSSQTGDVPYHGSLQRVARPPLGNTGRSQSVDSEGGRIVVGPGTGQTVYTTGPGGVRFSIGGTGAQSGQTTSTTPSGRSPVIYVRTNSRDRRSSSPKVQVTRIQDTLDSRRQRPHNFDDIIQKKIVNFLQGQQPQQVPGTQQYLFRHQPQAEETPSFQAQPKREEYIFVSRPRDVTPPQASAERRDSSGTAVRPGKKIVRTTREVIRDIGGGQTQTTRETHEELVDDQDNAHPPEDHQSMPTSPPVIQTDNSDTWKSTSSNDSGTGSGDRDIFKKFRFKFDSIGNFGRSDSRESTANKEQFHFQDFDDMVGRMNNLRVPVINQVHQEAPQVTEDRVKVKAICPYCKNRNPDCEYTVHHKCRQGVTLDCVGGATNKDDDDDIQTETSLSGDTSQADDADSGYHTGSSTLQSRGPKGTRKPPGEWTLTREDLRRGIETFNNNNHGLIMSLQSDTNTFQGFIRVHMNLIRPINMSLSTRPTSIYDVIGQGDEEEEEFNDSKDATQITSFYLPKDTTKVIHINSDTTTQEVIKALLSKFKITDNPRKFALYEKVLESEKKASMRRMEEDECPLPLCLCWTSDGLDGLDRRKFVLQENDTGEIMWEAFSLPELENFLRILNREEEEYVEQVKAKYRMLKIHMERRLKEINETRAKEDGKRRPVFV